MLLFSIEVILGDIAMLSRDWTWFRRNESGMIRQSRERKKSKEEISIPNKSTIKGKLH